MPHNRFPPDTPAEWMNRAKSNLLQARCSKPGIYLEDLCFNAQQAVEKALKALLIYRGVHFPYIHDLSELVRLLEESGEKVPSDIAEAVKLTDYAVEARYPGVAEPVTAEEYEEAVALADKVVLWVERKLKQNQID